jgi:3-phytase
MFRGLAAGFFILALAVQAKALKFEYYGETSIPHAQKFQKTTIGGLSALAWANSTLYALSDDKGTVNEPRFYEFDLKISGKEIKLIPKAVRFINGLPKENGRVAGLDPEGIARYADGEILISSEGNNNAKPREMPRVFRVNSKGKWIDDLPVPDKYLPELTGLQRKGIQNNLAFEGLSMWQDGQFVFTSIENCLTQDLGLLDGDQGNWIRILKFQDEGKRNYKAAHEFAYKVDPLKNTEAGAEVFRGVSEILTVSESKLLVLERGLRVQAKGLSYSVALYLADLSKATDTLAMEKLSIGKFTGVEKTKLVDFEADLAKVRKNKKVDNYEGLAWGPTLPDGRRSLLAIVDDNFAKTQTTELMVFAVEGE